RVEEHDNFLPVFRLDEHALEALADLPNEGEVPRFIEAVIAAFRSAPGIGIPGKGTDFEKIPPGGPLQIGDAGVFSKGFELLPGLQAAGQLIPQCLVVVFNVAVEIDQVAVEVVDDFNSCPRLCEKYGETAGE